MIPNIPISTDSIHKFYAGVGLVVFIASLVALINVQNSTNDRVLQYFEKITKIEKLGSQTDSDTSQLRRIEELIDVTKQDKKMSIYFLFTLAVFGVFVAGRGLQSWEKKMQPKIEERMDLELQLLREEVRLKKYSTNQLQRTRYTRR